MGGPLSSLRGPMISMTPDGAEVDLRTNVESALSKEVGFILLNLMDIFGTSFRVSFNVSFSVSVSFPVFHSCHGWLDNGNGTENVIRDVTNIMCVCVCVLQRELGQEDGDNVLMSKVSTFPLTEVYMFCYQLICEVFFSLCSFSLCSSPSSKSVSLCPYRLTSLPCCGHSHSRYTLTPTCSIHLAFHIHAHVYTVHCVCVFVYTTKCVHWLRILPKAHAFLVWYHCMWQQFYQFLFLPIQWRLLYTHNVNAAKNEFLPMRVGGNFF